MLLSVRVNNFLVYSNEVELSLIPDMRIKKFVSNVYMDNYLKALKSICIYGANNSGKTCMIRAIKLIKNVLLGLNKNFPVNIFTSSKKCSFGISFIYNSKAYSYDFEYDLDTINEYTKGFTYECFKELNIDRYGNNSERILFERDVEKSRYVCNDDKDLENVLSIVSTDNISIYTINVAKYPIIEKYRNILRDFASSIEIIDMNNIPIEKTIKVLKNDEVIKDKTIELIKMADLDIDDYKYVKNDNDSTSINFDGNMNLSEEILKATISINDMFKLVSVHKGVEVLSLNFDSTGTKKVVALASFVIDALVNGKTLIVDELDSSLHFILTRSIVALFNNELNENAQLIFTAHDTNLLDCKTLFRKDQIWFASKDYENVYLYSLADFTSHENKVRSESDLIEKYKAGLFGAIPEPDLISILMTSEANKGE